MCRAAHPTQRQAVFDANLVYIERLCPVLRKRGRKKSQGAWEMTVRETKLRTLAACASGPEFKSPGATVS